MSGQPVKRGTMAHDHHVYMLLTEAAVQGRNATALRQYAPRLEALAAADGHRLYLAIAHRAQGVAHCLAGEHSQAETRLDQAMELFGALDTRWQLSRTLYEMGQLNLARLNAVSARHCFLRALKTLEALRAAPDVARLQAALDALS